MVVSWSLPASWSRFFGLRSAEQTRSAPPPKPPAPKAARVVSREALEVAWLLCCLPLSVQAALVADLLAFKRARVFTGPLPVDDYTWPDVSGVRRPGYSSGVLKTKTLEGLCTRLRDDFSLGLVALCAPESALPRLTRNALLEIQGRRLGQVCAALALLLQSDELLALFRQELAARR